MRKVRYAAEPTIRGPFRPPLTEEQKERIGRAENPSKECGLIAVEEAKKQLSVAVNADGEHNALPESEDACLRVPAVDPRGQYSILSMKVSRRSRVLTRAEKLCWDESAADSLHVQARRLEVDPVVAEVDLVLQGVEYLLGIREGRAPAEVDRFYRETSVKSPPAT